MGLVEQDKSAPSEDVEMQDSAFPALEPESATVPDMLATESNDASVELPRNSKTSSEHDKTTALDEKPKSPENGLQIDTQAQPTSDKAEGEPGPDVDKPPDTAVTTQTNDLESLFGPMSAAVEHAPDLTVDPNDNDDFGTADPNTNDDFDFDAFGTHLDNSSADNNNLSTLLPGIQDYANTDPAGGDAEFDAMFPNLPINTEGQDDQQFGMEHRDSTFDDLLDLGEFNADDFSGGGGGGANENQDFNFDFE